MTEQEMQELKDFHNACIAELKKESFDRWLQREKYRIYKDTVQGTSKHCHNCMYCDKTKGKCLNKQPIEKKMSFCWKANNIKLLKKGGLYGTKRNIKTGID